jgi:restriction system protein
MPQSMSRSEWERQQAAQRREAERQSREQARLAKEEERRLKQQHLESQQRTADAKTAATEQQVRALDGILTDSLSRPPLTFQQLKVSPAVSRFSPESLGVAAPEPHWAQFAPAEPKGLSRLLGGASRHQRETELAKAKFEAARAQYWQDEDRRQRALAAAAAEHERTTARAQAEAETHNAGIDARQAAFMSGDPDAVEWFASRVLDSSPYPNGFPHRYQVAYRPENPDLVIEFELPAQHVVPNVRGFRYVKTRDAIDPIPRPQNEIKQRYAQLIASISLRTLHEIFSATPADVVKAVVFNGRVATIDRATGKPDRPHLLSVSTDRSAFMDLALAQVTPAACLKHLHALVSMNPFDMEAVEPVIAFDLKRFRFTDNMDVVAGLDSRPNLLKLTPTEFEHLVRQLFVAMGAEAWTTIPSKDGGIDAVATSKNLFFGGVCLIQAKRWTGVVGLDAVHALTGVMADHNATTGVLVTTSWFGRASEQFANRNRVTLINGAELKQLIKDKLHRDVIPGTSPPRRLRTSDNLQTGRPGPDN